MRILQPDHADVFSGRCTKSVYQAECLKKAAKGAHSRGSDVYIGEPLSCPVCVFSSRIPLFALALA